MNTKKISNWNPTIQALLSEKAWQVSETSYNPRENLSYETNFCLSNGVFSSRAVHEEGYIKETLPACYIHGVFDRSEAFQRELVNIPDWAKLKIYCEREPISPGYGEISDYERILDLKNGLLAKRYLHQSSTGRETKVESIKFLSRTQTNCALIKFWVTPLNYGGILEFENIIDGTVTNFMDFPRFRVKHIDLLSLDNLDGNGAYLQSQTRDFKLPIGTGCAVKALDQNGCDILRSRAWRPYGETACEFFDVEVREGVAIEIEKYTAISTGRNSDDVRSSVQEYLQAVMQVGFTSDIQSHKEEYAKLWDSADLAITGDDKLQNALRFNIFHLMSSSSATDNRVGIGAKLLHGEEYGGHSFWDTELFTLPFFDYVFPKVARNLVDYRYNLLDKARENAKTNGYLGAKYPWESADTGDEECPQWTIEPDGSCYRCYVADYEHHVTAAIAYGAVSYYNITGDQNYFDNQGLEILAETARFWASRLEYNESEHRYEIHQVTGPDEWHEPVDNNAYTNYLAYWNIKTALKWLNKYKSEKTSVYQNLTQKIEVSESEMKEWNQKADLILLKKTDGLIEQYDGYYSLEDAIITQWNEKGMPVLPESLREIPKEKRCILKQADVVMLMFLMPDEFDLETQRTNFEYYEKRTLQRSSLSPGVHCIVGLRTGLTNHAYQYLERSAYVDIENNQGNTREGIHAASTGITWQSVTLGYCGMNITTNGILAFSPRLPKHWGEVCFTINRDGTALKISVTSKDVSVHQVLGTELIKYQVNGIFKTSEYIYGESTV